MASQIGRIWLQSGLSVLENEVSETSCVTRATNTFYKRSNQRAPKILNNFLHFPKKRVQARRLGWQIAFALDTGGIQGSDGQESVNGDSTGLGSTRLGRIVIAGGKQLLEKLNSARKNFPMKVFLVLLGFYTANALATILGQTGDWDVLVAGIVVAAIEGIGMLMYKKPSSLSTGRVQSFVVMINYWKAGVCLGLFVDAFKLGS